MTSDRLDKRAVEKTSGPAWEALRPAFELINDCLLATSDSVRGDLTTIYIKYGGPETKDQPFGVVWIKKASELTVGLSLPEDMQNERLVQAPQGCKYAGLTKFVVINTNQGVPTEFSEWARMAYEIKRQQCA